MPLRRSVLESASDGAMRWQQGLEALESPASEAGEWRQFIQASEEYLKKNTARKISSPDDPPTASNALTAKAGN